MPDMRDRNFDDLIEAFEDRVYKTGKGDWRLKLLKQDLSVFNNAVPVLDIWDAGCGFAQISQWLAQAGHQLTLCDLSVKMLHRAKAGFAQTSQKPVFHHASFQDLAARLPGFDLVIFHAVLEWLADPARGLEIVLQKVKPGGYLSLLFYNRNAMVFANVLKGQWRIKPIMDDSYIGKGNKLSPPNPQYPHEIEKQLLQAGFEIVRHTGIRVFHDYMNREVLDKTDMEELFAVEARYCRMPVFQDMGRYIHLLAKKTKVS